MKRYIIRNFIVTVTFLILFLPLNMNKYNELNTPWFFIKPIETYALLFILFLINSYCYKLNNNKGVFSFYIMLILNSSFLIVSELQVTLFLLLILVVNASYLVNKMYKENKISGYLYLPYLTFVSYLLIVNQIIVFIN